MNTLTRFPVPTASMEDFPSATLGELFVNDLTLLFQDGAPSLPKKVKQNDYATFLRDFITTVYSRELLEATDAISFFDSSGLDALVISNQDLNERVSKGTDAWRNRHFWFAVRLDGNPGDGSVNNPFDASTEEKLVSLLVDLYNNNAPATLCFFPGEYRLPITSSYLFRVGDGWQIIGAGKGRTVFRCDVVPAAGTSPYMFYGFGPSLTTPLESLLFRGFTIRGPIHLGNAGGNYNAMGISCNVNNLLIEDVEIYGMGGDRQETFPIITYCHHASVNDIVCRHVLRHLYVHHCFHAGNGVGLGIGGAIPSQYLACSMRQSHIIEDCRLESCYVAFHNAANVVMQRNFIDMRSGDPEYGPPTQGFTCINCDTGINRGFVIDSNVLINARDQFRNSGAIHFGKPSIVSQIELTDVKITNNRLHVIPSGNVYSAIHFRRGVTNWVIAGNTYILDDTTTLSAGLYLDPQSNDVPNNALLLDTGEVYGNRVENLNGNLLPSRWQGDFKEVWSMEFASTGTWPNAANTVARPLQVYRKSGGVPANWVERLANGTIAFVNRYGVSNFQFGYKDSDDNYTAVLAMNNDTLWTLNAPFAVSLIRNTSVTSNTISGVNYHAAFGTPSGAGRVAILNGPGNNGRLVFIHDPNGTNSAQYIQWNGTTFSIGTQTNGIGIDGTTGVVSILNAAGYYSSNATGGYRIGSTKVVGARDTGWTAPTGTGSKTGFAAAAAGVASAAYVQSELQTALNRIASLEAHNKALYDALATHGLLGT